MNSDNRFLGLIEKSIKENWERPALSDYQSKPIHYKDVAMEIKKLHLLFEQSGLQKGDKISIVAGNSANWAISFFGILSYGCVAVPILHNFIPESIANIINHSESKGLIIAKNQVADIDKHSYPNLSLVAYIEDFSIHLNKGKDAPQSYETIQEHFTQLYPNGFEREHVMFYSEDPEELAVLNYTSGTTGFSKGVMLPYRCLWGNTKFAKDNMWFVSPGDNLICLLPMAHMYGLAFEIMNGLCIGCHIYFLPRVPSPNTVIEMFTKYRPRLIIAVPLIIEKIIRKNVFPVLAKPSIKFFLKIPGISHYIYNKIGKELNAAFGKDFFEVIIGGAAFNPEVEDILKKVKFPYTVGYGLTECGPLVSYAQWDSFIPKSVGRVIDRMEIKIDSPDPEHVSGEILVKGTNNMLGYYKNEEATQEVMLPDGWMRTGDLGVIDKHGNISIHGRSKTMILGANGQNIYPEEIESILDNLDYIDASLVVMRDTALIALVYPNYPALKADKIPTDKIQEVLTVKVREINKDLPAFSKIKSIEVMREDFEKTPKQSIKRFLYQ